ncbi:hypothetical protein EAF00_008059 [Botryotinia globosa]|nr:hypothetical protein EAF00_008059 [Botryotinia globosa]
MRLTGKVILITGCSSGIGVETARALSTTGATLYLTTQDIPTAEKALEDILEPGRVEILEMDLSSLAGVRLGAEKFLRESSKLNVLVCNAGIMAIPDYTTTVEGFETQFGVNHLANFQLFQLLKETLLSSASPSFNSRVVMVSSASHRNGGIRLDDYNYTKRPEEYDLWGSYSQSKTVNIYMANEIDLRYGHQGLHATSLMPGAIPSGIGRHLDPKDVAEYNATEIMRKTIKSPEQGAATTVLAAIGKEFENKGGVYLENDQFTFRISSHYLALPIERLNVSSRSTAANVRENRTEQPGMGVVGESIGDPTNAPFLADTESLMNGLEYPFVDLWDMFEQEYE